MWIFALLIFVVFALLAYLFWTRRQESDYLKKKTSEVLSPQLRSELEQETDDAKRRKEAFDKQLKKFGV